MGVILYNIFLFFLRTGISIASLFNDKARKWVTGRKNVLEKMSASIDGTSPIIWMHCASLGEFEQGRPIIERLKKDKPGYRVLLTFFSPSGYEVQKDYKEADWVFYLPVDSPGNARQFLEITKPALVIFVKYELWYYYLKKIKYRNMPLLLVSALFRKDMSFFKWYGGLQRKMLSRFDHLFVQNELSRKLAAKIGLSTICTVSGDTRFDRVVQIAAKSTPVEIITRFTGNQPVLVAGSTWTEDEMILQGALAGIKQASLKLIIAPHEIDAAHLAALRKLFPGCVFYSELASDGTICDSNVLVIDNIGMLSRLYRYGTITFVGGGFRKSGVHNVLEAAVYGKPVLYGPVYKKYTEAVELVKSGGGICIETADECIATIQTLLTNKDEYGKRAAQSYHFVADNTGATEKIMQYINEKNYLPG